jgi:hypothetical protein
VAARGIAKGKAAAESWVDFGEYGPALGQERLERDGAPRAQSLGDVHQPEQPLAEVGVVDGPTLD